jgi:hypothetical protein
MAGQWRNGRWHAREQLNAHAKRGTWPSN